MTEEDSVPILSTRKDLRPSALGSSAWLGDTGAVWEAGREARSLTGCSRRRQDTPLLADTVRHEKETKALK